ncbi:hypothetical protein ACHAW6_016141 [Cyclotella cf. meneghiniana]
MVNYVLVGQSQTKTLVEACSDADMHVNHQIGFRGKD